MAAIGIFMVYFTYVFLSIMALVFSFIALRKSKFLSKLLFILLEFMFVGILMIFSVSQRANQRYWEKKYVGNYHLYNYPDCANCVLYLYEDNTFEVKDSIIVREKGEWRYEFGADYFIVYMNEDQDQLGSGKFKYNASDSGFD